MAFLFGAFLGLVVGVAVVMAFARLENARAEQRRELVRARDPFPPAVVLRFIVALRALIWFGSVRFRGCRLVMWFLDFWRCLSEDPSLSGASVYAYNYC